MPSHHSTISPYQRAYHSQVTLSEISRAYLRDAYRQGFADGQAQRDSREEDAELDLSPRQRLAYAIGHIVGSAQQRYDNPWAA